ncbi:hypothetical protein QTP70_001286 [Hemibagrus guttatus]|uniref:SCAN box domain-containing protein n=1 Tax=Hemibagrus guttatus TaxID=175788 RepID=A0AAE0Q5Y3_9TELE|nr:hypothetical protein QTP70_001286 [Hemibagrus guttatus]
MLMQDLACGFTGAVLQCLRWRYDLNVNPQVQMDDILHICCRWLQPNQLSAKEVAELVAMDQFLQALPAKERKAVGLHSPTPLREFLERLECALATLEIGRDACKDFRPPPCRPQTP